MDAKESGGEGTKKNWRTFVTDGILLAVIPFVAYELNFIYEAGNGAFYGIPTNFVSFSLSSTISTLALVLGSLVLILNQLASSFSVRRSKEGSPEIVFENILLMLLFAFLIWGWGSKWFSALFYFLGLALIQSVRFMVVPLFQRNKKSYSQKVSDRVEKAYRSDKDNLLDYVFDFVFYRAATYLILLSGVLCLVFAAGYASANKKTDYYQLNNQKGWVVVRLIDDSVVLERVKGKQLINEIKYVSIKNDNSSLKKVKLGPLKQPNKL